MEKRQLVLLFGCSLIPWTIGNGIMPLLPVYAGKLGASSAESGAYLAIAYVAITLGALSASWISGRFGRKGPLVAVGLLAVPLTWLTGQVTNLWQLTAVTAALWLLGGMGFALTSILAGLYARPEERGRVFGVLSMTGPVGALLGGLAAGPMVDGWGFPAMFLAFALAALAWPVMALLVKDARIEQPGSQKEASSELSPELGGMFWLLFAASLVVMVANMAGVLGRSLVMDNLGFSAAAISSTGAVGGAVSLPFGLVAGVLSDRLGRKGLLAFGFLASALGLILLTFAADLWHFWLAISLVTVQNAVSGAVGSALVADLVPQGALGKGMALFSATGWLGGVVGFAAVGVAIQAAGFSATFFGAGLLALAAAGLLLKIRVGKTGG